MTALLAALALAPIWPVPDPPPGPVVTRPLPAWFSDGGDWRCPPDVGCQPRPGTPRQGAS